ncbi:MAG TPA: large-conductance mechanosensitive channel protein MscL [Cytophagaceae bacterium]
MKFIQEFKQFAIKGNLIDIAVGIVVGAAFGQITSSFVDNVLMPPIGLLIGGVDFSDLKIILKSAEVAENGTVIKEAVTMQYGLFIQRVIDFLIIAFSVFLLVKVVNSLNRKKEEAAAPAPAKPDHMIVLEEIRDLLKNK